MRKTFGPSVVHDEKTDNLTAYCARSGMYCFLLQGYTCIDEKPSRVVPKGWVTPDWCKYRAGMMDDIREMRDFETMGLAGLTRAELMPIMKEVPAEFRAQDTVNKRPFKLNEHNADMMRCAIRKFRLASGAA